MLRIYGFNLPEYTVEEGLLGTRNAWSRITAALFTDMG